MADEKPGDVETAATPKFDSPEPPEVSLGGPGDHVYTVQGPFSGGLPIDIPPGPKTPTGIPPHHNPHPSGHGAGTGPRPHLPEVGPGGRPIIPHGINYGPPKDPDGGSTQHAGGSSGPAPVPNPSGGAGSHHIPVDPGHPMGHGTPSSPPPEHHGAAHTGATIQAPSWGIDPLHISPAPEHVLSAPSTIGLPDASLADPLQIHQFANPLLDPGILQPFETSSASAALEHEPNLTTAALAQPNLIDDLEKVGSDLETLISDGVSGAISAVENFVEHIIETHPDSGQ
jgi:hypothetical protein